jgi:hypothetical protein
VEKGRTANGGEVSAERKVRVKFDTKIACMRGGGNRGTTKRERTIKNFSSLLLGANKKVFCFGRVDDETV